MSIKRGLIAQAFSLSLIRLKVIIRRQPQLYIRIPLLIFILVYPLCLGIGLALLYSINTNMGINPAIPYRDLMTFGFLVFFTTLLSYLMAQGITGGRNPYLKNRQDAYFFQRVPIESSVMYLSARFSGFFLVIVITIPFVILSFEPLMIALQLPWWRIGGVLLTSILTFNLLGDIADLSFFALRKYRRRGKWVTIWMDSSSPIITLVLLIVPVLAFLIFQQNLVPSYSVLANFIAIPLINSSLAITGFFFRSGVPWESWIALAILIIECFCSTIIIWRIARNHQPMEEITEVIPVLSMQEARFEELSGGKILGPTELVDEEIQGNVSFISKYPFKALIVKDWLAIKRIRPLRNHLVRAPIFIVLISIGIFIIPPEFFFYIVWFLIYPMVDFSLLLARIEVKKPLERYPTKNWDSFTGKFFITLIASSIYGIPLLLLGGVSCVLIIFIVPLLSTIIGRKQWGLMKIRILVVTISFVFATVLLYPLN